MPKKGTEQWRRIHHLSWPRGDAVNDYILVLPVEYSRFDDALDLVRRLGPGALLCKIDVKSAFRCIPVRPEDRHLLGMIWQRMFFVDLCLPFGLSSSPGIWELFSSAAERILRRAGLQHVMLPASTCMASLPEDALPALPDAIDSMKASADETCLLSRTCSTLPSGS